jgi:hypothetical protein
VIDVLGDIPRDRCSARGQSHADPTCAETEEVADCRRVLAGALTITIRPAAGTGGLRRPRRTARHFQNAGDDPFKVFV